MKESHDGDCDVYASGVHICTCGLFTRWRRSPGREIPEGEAERYERHLAKLGRMQGEWVSGDSAVDSDCIWTHNDSDECWDTECGQAFCFIDGGPDGNTLKFCCYCGKVLRENQG